MASGFWPFGDDDRKQLRRIEELCRWLVRHPTAGQIFQIDRKRRRKMAITGTNVGGNSVFEMDPVGAAAWPEGTQFTWTQDDPAITLGPDSGTDGNQVSAADAASDTAASYNVTCTAQMPAVAGVVPAPIVATANVPLIPTPPPVPTSGIINQLA